MRPKKWANAAEREAAKVAARRQKRADAKTPKPVLSDPETPYEAVMGSIPSVEVDPETHEAETPVEEAPSKASPGFVVFHDCPDVPHDCKHPLWLGTGRGTPREYKGKWYVLVARHRGNLDLNAPEHGVVTRADFERRVDQYCEHGRSGWSCHAC